MQFSGHYQIEVFSWGCAHVIGMKVCRATNTLFPVFLTEAPTGEGNTFLPLYFLWLLFAKADSQVIALGKRGELSAQGPDHQRSRCRAGTCCT